MLSSTTPNSDAQYFYAFAGIDSAGNSTADSGQTQTLGRIGFTDSSTGILGSVVFDIFKPFVAQPTFITSQASMYVSRFGSRNGAAQHNVATAFDGIQILTADAGVTMSGTYTVYGYRK